jgi:hypothetical protein
MEDGSIRGGEKGLPARVELVAVGLQSTDVYASDKRKKHSIGASFQSTRFARPNTERSELTVHADGISLLGESLAVTFIDRRKSRPISVDVKISNRTRNDLPGWIRSTVTPMLMADVVKVRLTIDRKMGAVLDSIEV